MTFFFQKFFLIQELSDRGPNGPQFREYESSYAGRSLCNIIGNHRQTIWRRCWIRVCTTTYNRTATSPTSISATDGKTSQNADSAVLFNFENPLVIFMTKFIDAGFCWTLKESSVTLQCIEFGKQYGPQLKLPRLNSVCLLRLDWWRLTETLS